MSEKRSEILICPSADGWTRWKSGEDGVWVAEESIPAESPAWDAAYPKLAWQMGLPMRVLQTMALKISSSDETTTVDDLVPLRLEAAGLSLGEEGVRLADWSVAGTRSDAKIVTVWSMEANALLGCPGPRVPASIWPAFMRWKWQARELVLWCEAGRWIAGFSSEHCPVHAQPCLGTENVPQLASDLRGQATALLLRGLTAMPERLVVRGTCPPFARELATELSLPLVEKPETPELLPAQARLIASEMQTARAAAVEARKWRLRIIAAAALWVAAAIYAGFGYFQAKSELADAEKRHEEVTPRAKAMRDVQVQLDDIKSVNLPDALPVDVLNRIAKTMPQGGGFRLTTFTVEGDRDVYLKGSAARADVALRFAQDLKRNKDLTVYQWEIPPPVQQKDGRAEFSYTGKFRANLNP
ncbi:MAG: hypothetical protein ACKO2G_15030 [Verrucomicrobiales bacterium]